MDILTISWWIGAVGILIAIIGSISYIISLNILRGEIRPGLFFIFIASFVWVIYSIIMIVFALKGISITDTKWMIIPLACTLTSVLFSIGTMKLMKILKAIQLKDKERYAAS